MITRLITASRTGAWATLIVGIVVFGGWLFRIPLLTQVFPGLVAMNPLTAITFSLAGFALLYQLYPQLRYRRGVSAALGLLVATIGLCKLLQLEGYWSLHLDQVFFREQLRVYRHPNEMAPNTAVQFLLLGIALLLRAISSTARSYLSSSSALAGLATLGALFPVVGYSYGLKSFYGIGPFIPMALHSAWTFLVFSLALLAANAAVTPTLLTSAGNSGILFRRLVPMAVLLPLAIGWLRLEGERAGLYNTQVGVALYAITTIIIFLFLIWRSAHFLYLADHRRDGAEESLFARDNLLTAVIECSQDVIYAKDRAGVYLLMNSSGAERLGRPLSEIVGRDDFALQSFDRASAISEMDKRILATERTQNFEVVDPHEGGSRTFSFTKGVLRERSGAVSGVVGIARDITERKQAELELQSANTRLEHLVSELTSSHEQLKAAQMHLIQAEKMQSLGRLTAGIAHEVKNPLNVLVMGLRCLEEGADETEEDRATILKEMKTAVQRADTVVSELLTFSSPTSQTRTSQGINDLVDRALRFVRHELKAANVELLLELADDLPRCVVDPTKIEQVLINLLTNACHAMADGGTLRVATSLRKVEATGAGSDKGDRSGRHWRETGSVVAVTIRDTGTGVSAQDQGHLFDPFFTTKPTGKGTGLGLTVCRSIIDLHGGTIRIENNAGVGATATVCLPTDGEVSGLAKV